MTRDTLNIELDITWVEHADYKEKLNLEITSGSEWDLVFDASWGTAPQPGCGRLLCGSFFLF